ncbi:MAG TPA: hypothetical protein VF550_19260 [Polyangia bacterium]
MAMPGKTAVVLALLLGLSTACSTSAAVERRSGPPLVGTIEDSDANRLYLTLGENERFWVERSDITEIDHPGKTGTVVGGILIPMGVGFLVWSPFLSNECQYDCFLSRRGFAIFAGVSALVSGIPVLLSNLNRFQRSRAAAEPSR